MSEQVTASERYALALEATECPLLCLLETFCADVRSRREAGATCEIVQAPYCDSFNRWRARIRLGGRERGIHWTGPSIGWEWDINHE